MSLADSNYVPNPCSKLGIKASSSFHVSSSSNSKLTVPCIFCADEVPQSHLNSDIDHVQNQEFRKMVKALYHNFQMKSEVVPPNCTEKTFPFCNSCKNDVKEIHQQQRIKDEAEKRIRNHLSIIEKNVMEMELLNTERALTPKKCEYTKLTDKIMEGIRLKLKMEKSRRKAEELAGFPKTPTLLGSNVVVRDNMTGRQFESNKASPQLLVDGAPSSRQSLDTQMTMDLIPTKVCPDVEVKAKEPERMDVSDGRIGNRNENSCTRNITNERSELANATSNGSPNPAAAAAIQGSEEDDDVVVIKREGSPPIKEPRVEQEAHMSRKKRSIYRGVSIYQVQKPNGKSLQCGVCQIMVPNTDDCYLGSSPFERMLEHIRTEHLSHAHEHQSQSHIRTGGKASSESASSSSSSVASTSSLSSSSSSSAASSSSSAASSSSSAASSSSPSSSSSTSAASTITSNVTGELLHPRLRPQQPIEFSCRNCNEKFTSKFLFKKHNKLVHIPTPTRRVNKNPTKVSRMMNCDICGKPIRGPNCNMLAHKFSHKNDDERLNAIAANEPGSQYTMLCRKRYKKSLIDTDLGTGATADNNCRWKCDLCPHRIFTRQNYYNIHMKSHARKNSQAKATSSTSGLNNNVMPTATVAASVSREFLIGRDMNGEELAIGGESNSEESGDDTDNVELHDNNDDGTV